MKNFLQGSFVLFGLFLLTVAGCDNRNNTGHNTHFSLKFTQDVSNEPLSGRALILLSEDTLADPDIPGPFLPSIAIGSDFVNWMPGEELIIDDKNSAGFLSTVNQLNGYYSVRVILDLDSTSCNLKVNGTSYSDMQVIHVAAGQENSLAITVSNVLKGINFRESEFVKLLEVESTLLSEFYNTGTFMEAGVVLPPSYFTDSSRYYPTVFVFPGWGTTHISASQNDFQQKRYGRGYGEEKIFVIMNQDCRYGYHVFADSENNGPRATSFIDEFIPAYEGRYRAVSDPNARYMVGQSSGAWAALWLMVNYPEEFGMVWAGSPDPVDFRDFIGHNLYARKANLFYDSNGNMTLATRSADIKFTNKDWSDMESVIGEGVQYQSFEAVFGRKDKNSRPEQVFNRMSGRISPEAFEHWKQYDINRLITNNPGTLKSVIDGKINITVADNDDFFLDGSVKLLKHTMDSLSIHSNIILLPEGGHNAWNDEIRIIMHTKMDSLLLKVVGADY